MTLNLEPFFNPKSIALVGASNNISSWGFIVAHNIIQNNYTGDFYPINPKRKKILGYKAYSTILDIPKEKKIDILVYGQCCRKIDKKLCLSLFATKGRMIRPSNL